MEKVAFLVEKSGEHLRCLLNPESLVVRRWSGVQPRRSASGLVTGLGLEDLPLLHTSGGLTEFTLELLFDVTLAGSTIASDDVRDLTRPMWELSENSSDGGSYGRPPQVRFVWGKSWNIPAVVVSVAERLEDFTPVGVPRRSWLKMRLFRTAGRRASTTGSPIDPADALSISPEDVPPEEIRVLELLGFGSEGNEEGEGAAGQRLDEVAYEEYGDSRFWRFIARFNSLDDPRRLLPGQSLQLPRLDGLETD